MRKQTKQLLSEAENKHRKTRLIQKHHELDEAFLTPSIAAVIAKRTAKKVIKNQHHAMKILADL